MLYGTVKPGSAGSAFARGFGAGAVSSGLRNIEDALWPEDMPGSRDFGRNPERAIATSGTGRDPKGMCGSPDPLVLADGLGNGRGYYGGRGHGGAGSRFSLGSFAKDVAIGGVIGGLSSVGFYKAGKAVEALRGSVAGRGSVNDNTQIVPYYPSNNGVVAGTARKVYLLPGAKIDRYGTLRGKYFSPMGTPLEMRALPHSANIAQYRQFEVIKPFEVEESIIKPWFGRIGLGTQYRSMVRAEILVKRGIIKILGGN